MNQALRARIYWARRFAQTPRTFDNWGAIMRDMSLGRFGHGPATLTFRTRSGVRIDTPNRPGARVPVYEIFAEDSYRLAWLLGPMLDRPVRAMDIGGHVGTFSVHLARLHPGATVSAFEPSATTASYLRRNVEQNGVADRVTVFQCALAAATGHASFADNGAGSGLNGLRGPGGLNRLRGPDGQGAREAEVPTISFDDAVARIDVPVDLVKIDCEGGEYDLVLGSSPGSWDTVRRVVIEHHPVPGHDWAQLREFFGAAGLVQQDQELFQGYGCTWLSRDPLPAPRGPLPASRG